VGRLGVVWALERAIKDDIPFVKMRREHVLSAERGYRRVFGFEIWFASARTVDERLEAEAA
jgi:hypothetical protein